MTTLVVSPHLDDALLSLAGTLQIFRREGQRVVVATVFSAGDEGHAVRRSEDIQALEGLGIEWKHLGLLDAPWRRRVAQTFQSLVLAPLEPGELPPVIDAIRAAIEQVSPDRLLLPLGVGEHLDHRLVHEAHRHLPGPLGFYEDRPYAFIRHAALARLRAIGAAVDPRPPEPTGPLADEFLASSLEAPHLRAYLPGDKPTLRAAAIRPLAAGLVSSDAPKRLALSLEPFPIERETLVRSAEAIGAYRSQLNDLFGDEAPLAALAKHPVERVYWRA